MAMKTRRLPLPEPDFFALAKNRRARQVRVALAIGAMGEKALSDLDEDDREKFIQTFIAERDDR